MENKRFAAPLTLRASFVPATLDQEQRTVELVWSTGAKVLRSGWDGRYYEELSMSPESVRLDRLNSGAPLLNAHNAYDLNDILGVVERAWLNGNEGRALVRFSGRAEVLPIFRDVQDGVIRNVSVGYMVHRYEKTEGEAGEPVTFRVTDWEPHELSLVPIPADAAASVRSNPTQDLSMDPENTLAPEQDTTPVPDPAPIEEQRSAAPGDTAAAIAAERKRASAILDVVARGKQPQSLADQLIRSGATIEQARDAVINAIADAAPHIDNTITVLRDRGDTIREGIANSLEARTGLTELNDKGRQFRGLSLLELAREVLDSSGVSTRGMSRMELAGRALHSTSDFPIILATLSNKFLARGYEQAPQTWGPFSRIGSIPDFRDKNVVTFDGRVQLERVNEAGEFTRTAPFEEGLEKYRLYTYGRVIGVTRQVLINDDLDALSRIPQVLGRAAADFESDQIYGMLRSNPVMGDGVALFNVAHLNLGVGSIGEVGISAARLALRTQQDLKGNRINLTPRYLLVPAELETAAEKFLTPISADSTQNVNVFARSMQLIVEPRLDDDAPAYYVLTDPGQIDMIEVGYLDGQRGPSIETREGFDVDGMEIKIRLDFGCKVINHRGFYKSSGVDPTP